MLNDVSFQQDIILSEILPNPGVVSDSDGEYVELFNPTASTIDITGYELCDRVKCNTLSGTVASGAYYMACINANTYTSCNIDTTLQLNNGGDDVVLKNANGVTLETVVYGSASSEESYVRASSDPASSWSWSASSAYTPGMGSLTVVM